MLLKLQKYVITLEYKKGKEMYLADALSRAYPKKGSTPQTEPQSEFRHQLEDVSLSEHLPILRELVEHLCDEMVKDTSLQILMQVITRLAWQSEGCPCRGKTTFLFSWWIICAKWLINVKYST